mgnify:CR=1 FL=1
MNPYGTYVAWTPKNKKGEKSRIAAAETTAVKSKTKEKGVLSHAYIRNDTQKRSKTAYCRIRSKHPNFFARQRGLAWQTWSTILRLFCHLLVRLRLIRSKHPNCFAR